LICGTTWSVKKKKEDGAARGPPRSEKSRSLVRELLCQAAMGLSSKCPSMAATLPLDPPEAAAAARLRYVSGDGPGIRRIRAGRSFRYRDANGESVIDPATVQRIHALAIPPAWRDVWICPTPSGHIQAVGRDARGRKQYRYHLRWREVRDETKFARLLEFGRALPHIRRQVRRDMRRPGLPREKVVATVVHLLETTLIRVGNSEYARDNGSYGLTTLRSRHVSIHGPRLRFEFHGKGGKRHTVDLNDRHVAGIVQRCQDLPGHELFQYVNDAGERQTVDSADINEYVRQTGGSEFTAKDFRTWAGSVMAFDSLHTLGAHSARLTKKHLNASVVAVAQSLRNTPAICRKCYIHPAILNMDAALIRRSSPQNPRSGSRMGLRHEERAMLLLLTKLTHPKRRAPRVSIC
jgi:DNA topoisomerase I